jgi:hypothetical protein
MLSGVTKYGPRPSRAGGDEGRERISIEFTINLLRAGTEGARPGGCGP